MTIAITGATGQLGRLAIAHLQTLTDPAGIIALARDPAKAADLGVTTRAFDYTAPDSTALKGVDVLALVSSSDFNDRVGQHTNVINAAKAAGVGRIIYTSIQQAEASPMLIAADHKATEAAIHAAGLPATILRNGWYTENWTSNLAGAISAGAMIGAAGDAPFTPATPADFAQALAVVAAGDGHEGQVYELGGDQTITLADIAAEVSRQTGKDIPYNNLPGDVYQGILESFGLPAGFATVLVDVDIKAQGGWLADTSGTLGRLLGRPTTSLSEAVRVALG